MPPYHVSDDIDLYRWTVDSVTGIGGSFTTIGEFRASPFNTGSAEFLVVEFEPHIAEFSDDSKLTIKFVAQQTSCAGWEFVTYSFDYRSADGALIFRYDKHDERWVERKFGTKCHLHLGNGHRQTHWSCEVDIDDVVGVIVDYQQTGRLQAA